MSQHTSSPRRVLSRPTLRVERLEDRTLLSSSHGVPTVLSMPPLVPLPRRYDSSSIVVRFLGPLGDLTGDDFLPGTRIGPELGMVPGLRRIQLSNGVGVTDAVAAYRASPLVLYSEPNYMLRPAGIPNDPQFPQLWGLYNTGQTGGRPRAHINAPPAWSSGVGAMNMSVGVVDTGIDYDHPDLYGNIWLNEREIPASRLARLVDTDGDNRLTFLDLNQPVNQGDFRITDQNGDGLISASDILAPMALDAFGNDLGYGGWANGVSDHGDDAHPDDLVGWDFANNTNTPRDTNGHGTHVAGIIGALGNNGVGVVGVNWRVRLMPLKIGDGLELNLAAAVGAIGYAVANGAKISNHSYVTNDFPQALHDAMASARDAGHLIVAAAGNDSSDNDNAPAYPASFRLDNIMAVAATDKQDHRADFTNYGLTTVHLGAPGVDIYSTSANGGYGMRSGTSMAAAYVSGAAALSWYNNTHLTYRQIIDLILFGSEPIPSLAGRTISGGRLRLAPEPIQGIVDEEMGGGSIGSGSAPGGGGPEESPLGGALDYIAVSLALATPTDGFAPAVVAKPASVSPEVVRAFSPVEDVLDFTSLELSPALTAVHSTETEEPLVGIIWNELQ